MRAGRAKALVTALLRREASTSRPERPRISPQAWTRSAPATQAWTRRRWTRIPADEISLILQKCSFFTLAQLALTNNKWAACVAPVMLTSWKEVGAAQLQVNAASDFDELAAVQLSLKRKQLEFVQEGPFMKISSMLNPREKDGFSQNAPQDPLREHREQSTTTGLSR